MWRTSCGERTLHGAEARLFAEALLSLLDEAGMCRRIAGYSSDAPWQRGVPKSCRGKPCSWAEEQA